MAYQGDRSAVGDIDAPSKKESNTQPQGREGAKTLIHNGPAVKGSPLSTNATESGGINRPTRGKTGKSPGSLG